MYSPQLILVLSIIFLGYLASTTAVSSKLLDYFCGSTGNYSANSTYDSNLQTLFKNLTTSATNSTSNWGFAKSTVGSLPNEIFGVVLCRGDVSSSECSSCISQATVDILNICPYNKESTIYYDFCLLRFSSNQDFLSPTNSSKGFYRFTTNNVSVSIDRFYNLVEYLLNSTGDYAAFNVTKKFGTSTLTDPNFPVIRGLTQCRPDISGSTCQSCLQNLTRIPEIFKGRQGGRIVNMMCNFRYEIYSFYEGASLLTVAPPADNAPARVPTVTKRTSTVTILAVTIPLVLAFVTLACLYVCLLKRRKSAVTKQFMSIDSNDTEEIRSVESLFLSLSTLRVATTNFAEENILGEGGFGVVYKGVFHDGREIAVKRLSECSSQGLSELKNELLLLAKLQHKNLVRLLGVCLEDQEKMLVYEYVTNKSLDKILFDTEKRHMLDWGKRYKIICGIARGLLYLHEESRHRIIHRDLKASNVLLDEEMNPKISDFGMARIFLEDQTQEVTRRVVGTFGYMAPEYGACGHFSIKSDAFSYGVLVLEIISGKKNSYTFENEDVEGLLNIVWKHWTDGTMTKVVDPLLGQHYPTSELLRCIHIALLCVQDKPTDRPTMSNVALMLSSETVSLRTPFRPAFCNSRSGIRPGSSSCGIIYNDGNSDRSSSKSIPMSSNEISITVIEPR